MPLRRAREVRLDVIGLLKTLLCVEEKELTILGYPTRNGRLSFCFFISDIYKKPERATCYDLESDKRRMGSV